MGKYARLDHLETCWQKEYLLQQHRKGVWITRHSDRDLHAQCIQALQVPSLDAEGLEYWKQHHLSPTYRVRCDQALRARRKRYFDAEELLSKKKSVDLTFSAWQKLQRHAKAHQKTLSQTIEDLLFHWANPSASEATTAHHPNSEPHFGAPQLHIGPSEAEFKSP